MHSLKIDRICSHYTNRTSNIKSSLHSASSNIKKRYFNSYNRGYGNNYYNDNTGAAVYGIIGANLLIFGMWNYDQFYSYNRKFDRFMKSHFTTSIQAIKHGYLHTLVTSTFSHSSFWHLASNLMGLFFFGRTCNAAMGNVRFLQFYLFSGLVGSAAQLELNRRETYSPYGNKVILGASGAVNACIAVATCLNPRATVIILPIPVPIPMVAFAGGYLFYTIYSIKSDSGGGVAHGSHIGGLAAGAFYFVVNRLLKRI